MDDTALVRRQFLGGAGAAALAMAAGPTSPTEGRVPANASDGDAAFGSRPQGDDRVALLCLLRSATARG